MRKRFELDIDESQADVCQRRVRLHTLLRPGLRA